MKLIELIEKNNNYGYESDPGTDKESTHKFITEFYEDAFEPYKNKSINVLEVGINTGGSLLLWKDYFTQGNIFGVDITDSLSRPKEEYENIKIFLNNGYDISFVNSLPNLDIVIDDGPHTLETQIAFINLYLPKLNPGGMLVIEDIPNIEHIEYFKKQINNNLYKTIDTREKYNQFDNILFAVWRST